jgi:hypothetical protein
LNPKNVGMAMAIRTAMMRTTTISSTRVKPSSSRNDRDDMVKVSGEDRRLEKR